MKTRRILAASTAALLAFGTTAIVASAAAAGEGDLEFSNIKIELADGKTAADFTSSASVDATFFDITATKVAYAKKGGSGADKDDIVKGDPDDTYSVADGTDGAKVTITKGDISYKVDVELANWDGKKVTKSAEYKIQFAADEKANLAAGAGSSISLGGGVTASADKSAKKDLKDYMISAKALEDPVGDSDDDDALIDVEESKVIKGLNDDLKAEFAKVKPKNVKIVNVEVSKDGYVENKAPAAITLKVDVTGFKPSNVYHVSGDTVEAVSVKSVKLKAGTDNTYTVEFQARNFSPFIITSASLKNVSKAPADDTSDASAATSNAGTSTNPETGIALAIAPVVLAAGAVAVVALKKKH